MPAKGENAKSRISGANFSRLDMRDGKSLKVETVRDDAGFGADFRRGKDWRSQVRGRGDNDRPRLPEKMVLPRTVKFEKPPMPSDVGMPGDDPGNFAGKRQRSQMRHGVWQMQMNEVERPFPMQAPRFADQPEGKGKAAIHIPAGRANDRRSIRQGKAATTTIAGRDEIDELHLAPERFEQRKNMRLDAARQVIAETTKTEYAHSEL